MYFKAVVEKKEQQQTFPIEVEPGIYSWNILRKYILTEKKSVDELITKILGKENPSFGSIVGGSRPVDSCNGKEEYFRERARRKPRKLWFSILNIL